MRFEYFRFLLTPVKEPELPLHGKSTREEVIAKIFSDGKHYTFKSGRATYGFVVKNLWDKKVFGRVGKQTSKRLFSSPSEGFQEKKEEDWPGSHVLINLDDEHQSGKTKQSGQVIAIQVNKTAINNPTLCLRALADKINEEIIRDGFYISINPILKEKKSFWSVVDENRGQIRKVVLTYTPPNLFNLKNKLEDDLREANQTFNTTSTQVVLENEMGNLDLPKNNELLKESAEYIDQGAGSYQVHLSVGKKVIKSEAGVRSEEFVGTELIIDGRDDEKMKEVIQDILESKHHD